MSIHRVNPNVIKVFDGEELDAAGGAAPNVTSKWFDVGGWTDKRVSVQVDGANTDYDVIMHISPQHYYELNNKTATTDDYEAVTLLTANNVQTLTSVDAEDIDELQRPFRSVRFYVDNDSATAVTELDLWVEGWS